MNALGISAGAEKADYFCPHCGTKRPSYRLELSTHSTVLGDFSVATFFCGGFREVLAEVVNNEPRFDKFPCGRILGVQIINFEFGSVQERARRAWIAI